MKNATLLFLCITLLSAFCSSAQLPLPSGFGAYSGESLITLSPGDPAPAMGTEALDDIPPTVVGISRTLSAADTLSATSVNWRVIFSEPVLGVDGLDFSATPLTGNVRGTLALLALETAGAEGTDAVTPIGTDGTTYEVTVRAIAGSGTLRLDLNPSGTDITDLAGNALSGGFAAGETCTIYPAPVQGFASFSDISALPISSHTGQKPQAKLWTYAGKWWSVLATAEGTKLLRLDGASWNEVLKIASSKNSKADCQVVGGVVHILLFRGGGGNSYLVSVEYDPVAGTYKLWSGRKQVITLVFEPDTETATLAIDGAGTMWIASDDAGEIKVRRSQAPYSNWSDPVTIATGIMTDDICAVTALPGKIGVFWSNQLTQRFGFKTHTNGSDPYLWSADEVPAAQSALRKKYGMADDHMNLMATSDGTLYCAVKTGYDSPGYPKVSLLVRRPTGVWDNLYPVTANEGTRPIVLLNEALGKIRVVYSSLENGGDILYRESALSPIAFGPPITLMSRNYLFNNYLFNYATSTHQACTSDVVILASSEDPLLAVSVLATDNPAGPARMTAISSPAEQATVAAASATIRAELLAFPNPFSGPATVTYTLPKGGDYFLTLLDSRGRVVSLLKQGKATAGSQQVFVLEGTGLSSGVYFVRLQTASGSQTLKLVLKK
ncbi:T9SS type A sorting domain-containing protein [Paraflavisolibacter sp. H34]|uniref:T9SS type A sorting domain-containing protein n=1 Tax=Huijunlia imazamoxiresistens TaxID=3127457 RepID=UPI003015AECC